MLVLEDFVQDSPWSDEGAAETPRLPTAIHDLQVWPLIKRGDDRGDLCELLTLRDGGFEPIVHVYQVNTIPGSVRAWVYHKHQWDRLSYTEGKLRVVLYDIRPDSPSFGKLDVLDVGVLNPVRLHIPPLVIHAVQNRGKENASFINMPTEIYDPSNPDKARLPPDHPDIPYTFDN